ncbi:hypothetical protein CPB85DRAFT_541215 [Mucidula mucida]|nr:hypothetical protein CPB85DRAFT_541215 [Mucidula mucida]
MTRASVSSPSEFLTVVQWVLTPHRSNPPSSTKSVSKSLILVRSAHSRSPRAIKKRNETQLMSYMDMFESFYVIVNMLRRRPASAKERGLRFSTPSNRRDLRCMINCTNQLWRTRGPRQRPDRQFDSDPAGFGNLNWFGLRIPIQMFVPHNANPPERSNYNKRPSPSFGT